MNREEVEKRLGDWRWSGYAPLYVEPETELPCGCVIIAARLRGVMPLDFTSHPLCVNVCVGEDGTVRHGGCNKTIAVIKLPPRSDTLV